MQTKQSQGDPQRLHVRTQPHAVMHKRMGRDLERMPDRVDFNDGQVTQIKALFDESARAHRRIADR